MSAVAQLYRVVHRDGKAYVRNMLTGTLSGPYPNAAEICTKWNASMAAAGIVRALPVLALLVAAPLLRAQDAPKVPLPEPPPLIKAQTQIVAAIECRRRGYRFMLRLSPYYVTCLRTNAGVSEAIDVNAVLRPQS